MNLIVFARSSASMTDMAPRQRAKTFLSGWPDSTDVTATIACSTSATQRLRNRLLALHSEGTISNASFITLGEQRESTMEIRKDNNFPLTPASFEG